MISLLKSETARSNGAKSRGPTSAEGRAKSSRNALKHGLSADSDTVLLDCEDPAQFNELLRKLRDIHKPATSAEKDLVEEMASARWRLRRMSTIEAGLLNAEVAVQQSKSSGGAPPSAHLASAFRALADESRSLALASRYEARLHRQYDRAYKTLRELQQVRQSQQPTKPTAITVRWVKDPAEPTPPHPTAAKSEFPNEPTRAADKELLPRADTDQPPSSASPEPPEPKDSEASEDGEPYTHDKSTPPLRR
jgi:hypothetical protein